MRCLRFGGFVEPTCCLRSPDARTQLGEIEHYIAIDRPLDCAGSFKWEALGISLFEFVQSPDPTALRGFR